MTISNLDFALGGLLSGTWANSMLIILEVVQVYRYFKTYPEDSCYFKAIVALLFSNDLACTVAEYACVYLYCVTHWGDTTYLEKQHWPIFAQSATTCLSAAITQLFLIYRFWRLSHNPFVTVLLLALALVAVGTSFAIIVLIVQSSDYSQRPRLFVISTTWLITGVVADVCIALALIWQFRRLNSYASLANTRAFIHRLVVATIKTGSATSIVVLIAFSLYIVNTEANFSVGFLFTLGRVYSLTTLVNLNARNRLHDEIEGGDNNFEPSDWLKTSRQQREAHQMSVIHIVKTFHVEDLSTLNRNLDITPLPRAESNHSMDLSNNSV